MLIDYTKTRQIIENYLEDNFDLCPIQMENVPLPDNSPSEYISVTDRVDVADNSVLQAESFPCAGTLVVMIFTKLGTGTRKAREIASLIDTMIGAKTISGIGFEHGALFGVPAGPKQVYYQHTINFRYSFIYGEQTVCE